MEKSDLHRSSNKIQQVEEEDDDDDVVEDEDRLDARKLPPPIIHPVSPPSIPISPWKFSNLPLLSHQTLGLAPLTPMLKSANSDHKTGKTGKLLFDIGSCFSVDFGGSLTKILFFEPDDLPEYASAIRDYLVSKETFGSTGVRERHLAFRSEKLRGTFHFVRYESSRTLNGAFSIIKRFVRAGIPLRKVHATGGGAFKYADLFQRELGIVLAKQDELESVVRGIVFMLLEDPDNECFSYEQVNPNPDHHFVFHDEMDTQIRRVPRPVSFRNESFFPFLVVNIGSGVSIMKVDSPADFRRVSGTALGGATFYGLCKLLTRCETYDEAMDFAERGNSRNVNLRVEDLYGGSYDRVGLPGNLTACFFGKAAATHGKSRPASSSSTIDETILAERKARNSNMSLQVYYLTFFKALIPTKEFLKGVILGSSFMLFILGVVLHHLQILRFHQVLEVLNVEGKVESFIRKLNTPIAIPMGAVPVILTIVFLCSVVLVILYLRLRKSLRKRHGGEEKNRGEHVFRDEDIARALVVMISQNVTQIAYLNAKLYNTRRVIFTGNFLRHNAIAFKTLSNMMRMWSKDEKIDCLFLQHEGLLGAIGCFLYSLEEVSQKQEALLKEAAEDKPHKLPAVSTP